VQAALEVQKVQFEREKLATELQIERERLAQEREIKLIEIQAQVGLAQHSAETKASEDGERKATDGKSLDALKEAIGAMSKARRVIRDENGEIVGVEPIN